MKKLLKSGICGSVNSARMHCLPWKSQPLQLLFNEQCTNSSCITPETCGKKKKKKEKERNVKLQTQTQLQPNPNGHLVNYLE